MPLFIGTPGFAHQSVAHIFPAKMLLTAKSGVFPLHYGTCPNHFSIISFRIVLKIWERNAHPSRHNGTCH
jgi:hypothetical protein